MWVVYYSLLDFLNSVYNIKNLFIGLTKTSAISAGKKPNSAAFVKRFAINSAESLSIDKIISSGRQ
ncbi:hypothetical protein LEP1GSC074_2109 [Leptospira noguchii str. Hook]|nr:hypothetical protein LEP1GSC074_2109 [Leptospira noguchii str. Hook]